MANVAEDEKEAPWDASWTQNLRHESDPNRVKAPAAPLPVPAAQAEHDEPSYYDIPMLKPPVWKWQIAAYFFLGGLSAGAYLLGRAAERFGGPGFRNLARPAAYLALATLLPSPPLLISDLGDSKRFHHMLRVFKPESPMNLGTFVITAYGGVVAFEVLRQYGNHRRRRLSPQSRLLELFGNDTLGLLHDLAGVPLALGVAGYTGVLLSCTANPLWCKSPWLGPLFSASAISTSAEALDVVLHGAGGKSSSQEVLQRIATIAHVAELASMAGFLRSAGERAKPLRSGRMSRSHKFGLLGIVGAEVLKRLPWPAGMRRPMRILANGLGLLAGLSMRWSMVLSGHEAASDPHLSRLVSQTENSA